MNVKIKLVGDEYEKGRLPEYKRTGDACMDCYSRGFARILHGQRALVPLGFALELPVGYEAIVRPRSGMSKAGVDVCIGTIDSNYRGEVMACVVNNSGNTYVIGPGDRICQLAIREAPQITWEEVKELSDSNRGEKGFGSSGV